MIFMRHTVGLLSTPPVDSQGKSGGNARNRRTRFVAVSETQLAQLGEVLAIGHNLEWRAEHVLNCNNKEPVIAGCVEQTERKARENKFQET